MQKRLSEQMKEFEQWLHHANGNMTLCYRLFGYFLETIGYLVLLTCVFEPGEEKIDYFIFVLSMLLCTIGLDLHVRDDMQLKHMDDKGNAISIYQLLAYVPVNPKDIYLLRVKQLLKRMGIRMGILFACIVVIWVGQGMVTLDYLESIVAALATITVLQAFDLKPKKYHSR